MDAEQDRKLAEEALSRGLLTRQQLEECWSNRALSEGDSILDVAVRAHHLTLGQAAEVQQALLPPGVPHKLGRYLVVQPLGRGGMGAVYKAYDPDLDRYVAAKTLLPQLASDSGFMRRFRREARLAARLQSPHAIRVYDVGRKGGTHYIVMEFVDGESVHSLVLRKGRLDEREAFAMCADVAHALEEAWEHRIIHRDIKPQNIMIDRKGSVKLADLGLAKQLSARHDDESGQFSLSTWVIGTPRYMSPEQVMGKELDFRSDAFSLGVTLY
jgi:serine/threonine-protein kinase